MQDLDRNKDDLKVIVAVDDFTAEHKNKIREAMAPWAQLILLPQNAPEPEIKNALKDAVAMVGWPDPRWLPESSLKLLQIGSSGWDAYESVDFKRLGMRFCTGKGNYTIGVAEHCLAMMMYFTRNFFGHFHDQQNHLFRRHENYGEITGSTACIVGLGEIGKALAKRCKGLEMNVSGVGLQKENTYEYLDQYFMISDIQEAIAKADHVFATLTGGQTTRNFFSKEVLSHLKPDACFYNVSRGSVVDQDYLFSLLKERKIHGAGLDVMETEPLLAESPWWQLDNVLITGHCGGLSAHWPDRFCQLAIENLTHFFQAKPLKNEILFP